jgi:lipopolysaccharide export system permease protein
MLFDASVRKELARSFGAALVVILGIVLTMFLIRTVGQAAAGAVAPQDVVLLLGYVALQHLPTMLALSAFVAVVTSLGRMYRDSEMAVWFASGVPLVRFVRPVLRTLWPVLLVIAVLLLFVWPWGQRMSLELRDRYAERSDLARVAPGVFQASRDGSRVFFVERESVDGIHARSVFILTAERGREAVTTAQQGRVEALPDGRRFLVLESGQRNETDTRDGARSFASFEQYRVLAGERALARAEQAPPRTVPTIELLRRPTPAHQGELGWRLGMLLAAANLVLLGVGLAATNPRRASNWNLLFALLAFICYYNLVTLSQGWVAAGRVSLPVALAALHAGALAVAVALIAWRDTGSVRRVWPWPRRRTTTPAGAAAA